MQKKRSVHNQNSVKKVVGKREQRRLAQLGICIFLFCAVMLGKGIAPAEMQQSSETLLEQIRRDTDFKSVFSSLGHSFDADESFWESVKDSAVEIFFEEKKIQEPISLRPKGTGPASQMAKLYLQKLPSYQSMLIQLAPDQKFEE